MCLLGKQSGPKLFVRLSKVSALEHVRFSQVLLYLFRILTAVNMRNKPFLAIISPLVTFVDLNLQLETLGSIQNFCCTF